MNNLPAPKDNQTTPVRGTIRVSREAHDLVLDLEQALMRIYVADTEADLHTAYQNLNYRRRDLYERLESLEETAESTRTVTLRF